MPNTALAAAPTAPPLSLSEAMARTLARNPALAVFGFRQQALDGSAITASLRPAVSLDAELENFAGTDGTDNTELTVALSSVIELGGKREARSQLVNSERFLLDADRQIAALDLLGEVTRRYVKVLAAAESVTLAGDAMRLALDTLRVVRARVTAGGAPMAEQRRAQATYTGAELRYRLSQQQLLVAERSLAAMWGDLDAEFSISGGQLYRIQTIGDFEDYFARALQNPLITRFASEARVQQSQLRLAQSQTKADVGWALGVRGSNETDSTSLIAGIQLPLFSGARAQGEIQRAHAALGEVTAREERARLNLHTQLYRAFATHKQAALAVSQLRTEIIPVLSRALEETEALYRAGGYRYQEWVAAREELLEARWKLIEEATRGLLAGAELEQLTAAPLVFEATPTSQE
ncbi:TolC family protein [Microbulbifer agarilyticus]